MNKKWLVFLLVLPFTVVSNQWECGERSNLPQEGKNYCAAGDFRHSEKKLGKLLESLILVYQDKTGDASVITDSQRAFVNYRDSQCIAEAKHIENEPYHSMVLSQCKTRLSSLRIVEIEKMWQKHH